MLSVEWMHLAAYRGRASKAILAIGSTSLIRLSGRENMGGYESAGGTHIAPSGVSTPNQWSMVLSARPPDASNLERVPWQWTPGAEVGGAARSVPAMADVTNWGAAVLVTSFNHVLTFIKVEKALGHRG